MKEKDKNEDVKEEEEEEREGKHKITRKRGKKINRLCDVKF